jgi:membrane protein YqaA with SNARE-associated domain
MESFVEFGYIGLFTASFLAATILPLSSEIILSLLLINQFNPLLLIAFATTGNILGSFVNYALGAMGSVVIIRKVLKTNENDYIKAKKRFEKWGLASLLFAWVPVIGDPLTIVAGALRVNFLLFFILVATGKLVRYAILSYVVIQNLQ